MKKKERKTNNNGIVWFLAAAILFIIGVMGFTAFPDCYKNASSPETHLGCYSIIAISSGFILISLITLYYLLDVGSWIRKKNSSRQRKNQQKRLLKDKKK